MARNSKAKAEVNHETKSILFTFDGGKTFTAKLSDIPVALHARLTMHGLRQKLGDAYAGPDVDPLAAVTDTFATLKSGEWTSRAPGEPRMTILAVALAELSKKPIDYIQAQLDEASKETRANYRADPRVKAVMDRIEAERAAEKAKASAANAKSATGAFDLIS